MERRQLLQGVLTAAALACSLSVAVLTGTLEDQRGQRRELFGRTPDLAGKLGLPNGGFWASDTSSLTDNIGTNNMAITDTIRSIKATQDQPNFAAALHKLEKSTASASLRAAELTEPSDWLDPATPQLPDPQGFVHRMQRMRLSSRYCRIHPESCKTLAPEFPGLDGIKYASDEMEQNPADPLEQGTAADLLQDGLDAGNSAEEAERAQGGDEMKVRKARTQSLAMDGAGNGLDGMPWLAPYSGQQGYQNLDENLKWGVAAEEAAKPEPQSADPLWCGSATCAEHSYARHQHSLANILPHVAHNEAALRIGGERNAAEICAKTKMCGDGGKGGGKGVYGHLSGTIPTVLYQQQHIARTMSLAQVPHHYKFQSRKLGERTYNGGGDSLLPHGQLWGLKGRNNKVVRYHEYNGFYKGSQPDRAVVESPKQAAADSYQLESKELETGMERIHAHNAKLLAAANRVLAMNEAKKRDMGRDEERADTRGGLVTVAGDKKDFEEGAALFEVAASPAGAVLPRLDQLSRRGRDRARDEGRAHALPRIRGLDMSIVAREAPALALAEEEKFQSAEQQRLSRLAKMLP